MKNPTKKHDGILLLFLELTAEFTPNQQKILLCFVYEQLKRLFYL